MGRTLVRSLLSLVAAQSIACGSARRGEPIAGPVSLSAREQQGQVLFMHDCNQCHPGGDAATGPAINNKPLPRAVMKLQIRKGVLGTMPAFSEAELSDPQVELILDYMEALQDHE
jgi:mono/diheme cytochrome c family protein